MCHRVLCSSQLSTSATCHKAKSMIMLFADDTAVYLTVDEDILQADLHILQGDIEFNC